MFPNQQTSTSVSLQFLKFKIGSTHVGIMGGGSPPALPGGGGGPRPGAGGAAGAALGGCGGCLVTGGGGFRRGPLGDGGALEPPLNNRIVAFIYA